MEVYLEFHILVVIDCSGFVWSGVVNDFNDTIQLSAVDNSYTKVHFEAEACHLKGWCKEYGFKYYQIHKQLNQMI